jgi:hypothetical protein
MAYPTRKLKMPLLHDSEGNIECKMVPIATGLIPFFRTFWDSMRYQGAWETIEDFERARKYFGWQERMMLCNLEQKLVEQQENDNKNLCTFIAVIVVALSEGAIDPLSAMSICNVVKDGIGAVLGSTEDVSARQSLVNILEASVGKNTNQLEMQNKTLTELIGGAGILPPVD